MFVLYFLTMITALTSNITTEKRDLPLTAVQLLWVNLIMDTFAALALATEPPDGKTLLKFKPYGRFESLITSHMWVAIIAQAGYQLIVLFGLYYIGPYLNIAQDYYDWNGNLQYHSTEILNCMVFNSFVFCQIFNQWNCRKIYKNQWNILQNLLKSYLFLVIFIITTIVQVLLIEMGRISIIHRFVKTTGLNWYQWVICLFIASISIPLGFLVRLIQLPIPDFKSRRPTLEEIKESIESDEDDAKSHKSDESKSSKKKN